MTGAERWTPAYDRMFDPEHHLAGDEVCRRWAWLDLCHMARYEDGVRIIGGTVVELRRGELIVSLRYLADRWRWSVKRVRTFLELMEDPAIHKLETVRGTPKGTVYRVVNYGAYATPGHSKGHNRGTGGAQVGHKEQQGSTKEQQGKQEKHTSDWPSDEMWSVWVAELGGKPPHPKFTAKRRTKFRALWDEWLSKREDGLEVFRRVCRLIATSDFHANKREYQMPESTFNSRERRETWVLKAIKPVAVVQTGGDSPSAETAARLEAERERERALEAEEEELREVYRSLTTEGRAAVDAEADEGAARMSIGGRIMPGSRRASWFQALRRVRDRTPTESAVSNMADAKGVAC